MSETSSNNVEQESATNECATQEQKTDSPRQDGAATKQRAALPEEVPYVNQYYSYADRRRDINLMLLLIDEKRDSLREELSFVNQCCATRQYPNITGIDDTEG